jgi:DNA polymerase-3 subunit delta'
MADKPTNPFGEPRVIEDLYTAPTIGNAAVVTRLRTLVTEARLHPCLLLEGPAGVGKARVALTLAALANCEGEAPAPCGACWPCRQIARGRHTDILWLGLDPEKTAPIISVSQARLLLSALTLRPAYAKRRFVIIDPADAMGPECANALLKTLEEPPDSTGFILLTERASRLLVTVRSRAQRVRMGPVHDAELLPWLAARGVEDPLRAARLAGGSPGGAMALAEGSAERWVAVRDQALAAIAGPIEGMFSAAEGLVKGDRARWLPEVLALIDALSTLCRDALLLCGAGAVSDDRLFHPDRRATALAWAAALGPVGVARVAGTLERARADIEAFVNARLVLDGLFTRLATELGPARVLRLGVSA